MRERKINDLVDYAPPSRNNQDYKCIEVHPPNENRRPLDYASKQDCSPSFIREVMAYCEEQAESLMDDLPST